MGGKWIKALIDKIQPVPKIKLTELEGKIAQLTKEKWALSLGLGYSENRTIKGPNGNNESIEQFLKEYKEQEEEIKRLRSSEAKFQSQLQLKTDELNLLKKEPDK